MPELVDIDKIAPGHRMMDQAYQSALRKRDDLKRQLAEADEFLRLWNRVLGSDAVDGVTPSTAKGQDEMRIGSATQPLPQKSPTRERAAEIARKVTLSKGAPMTRSQLVEAFEAEGTPVGGVKPSRNMGTIMWRLRDRFINLDGLGYWPADVANERCGYTPELGEKATTSLREEEPSPGAGLGR